MNLLLASTSPRRQELLALLGLPFVTMAPSSVERIPPKAEVIEVVQRLALEKACSCSSQYPHAVVLGSDTLLSIDGDILGKPEHGEEAKEMLCRLQGRAHLVHTGLALRRESKQFQLVDHASATVFVRPLHERQIEAYLQQGEWVGKAGGYAIQGAAGTLIERIEGDFTAVVGLPLRLVVRMLQEVKMPIPADIDQIYRDKPYPNWARFAGDGV